MLHRTVILAISVIAISLTACSTGSENTASPTPSTSETPNASTSSSPPQQASPESSVAKPQVGSRQFSQDIQLSEPLKSGKVNTTVKIPILVKNTSNFAWDNKGSNPVNFGYHWTDENGKVVVFNGDRTGLPKSLAPQESIKLNAAIKLPDHPGKYTLTLTMVNELVAWFDKKGAQAQKISVTVIP